MYSNLALSGGAHLCVPFLGFLRAAGGLLRDVRWVSGESGGALVALAWVLEIPDNTVLRVLARHMAPGIMRDVDLARLLDRMGLVDVERSVGEMCREMIAEGVSRWNVMEKGWHPCPDDARGEALTMQQLCKMTGRSLAIGVCDAGRGFAETYITPDTHPDVEVWRALSASCAVPFAFTPVRIGGSLFCDACVRRSDPVRGIPGSFSGIVDTLCLEVQVLSGAPPPDPLQGPLPAPRQPSLPDYCKGVLSALVDRISYAPANPRARVVRISRWTEEKLDPLVVGTGGPSLVDAYQHGVRCGKDFLDVLNKETARPG